MKLFPLLILTFLFFPVYSCTKSDLEAISRGEARTKCELDSYKNSIGKMASHNGCNVFKKTLSKVREHKHEIPSKALFDTIQYLLKNFNSTPTENNAFYKTKKGSSTLEE